MTQAQGETQMRRYECAQCPMSATVVHNQTSRMAWRDHMAEHPDRLHYSVWAWEIVPLHLSTDAQHL